MAPRSLSELVYASYYTYSPRGTSVVARDSRRLRDAIKGWDPDEAPRLVGRAAAHALTPQGQRRTVLGRRVTLVPAPRSAPLQPGWLWPGLLICEALHERGIGVEVKRLLRRTRAVQKAAFASPGQRPTVEQHVETLAVVADVPGSDTIVIVDDFITQGHMLMACARRLAERFPRANITGFALVRTMGLVPDIDRVIDPVVGTLEADLFGVSRNP